MANYPGWTRALNPPSCTIYGSPQRGQSITQPALLIFPKHPCPRRERPARREITRSSRPRHLFSRSALLDVLELRSGPPSITQVRSCSGVHRERTALGSVSCIPVAGSILSGPPHRSTAQGPDELPFCATHTVLSPSVSPCSPAIAPNSPFLYTRIPFSLRELQCRLAALHLPAIC